MRAAHHAGNLVTGTRQPHRQMAADGARAENTDAHGMSRSRSERQFPHPCVAVQAGAIPGMRLPRPASAERDGSRRAAYAIVPRQIGRNGGSLMSANPVLWKLDDRGVATVTLNRPEVNNAYDGALIQGVLAAMDDLAGKPLRVVVLKGNGRHFQAGADLRWINSVRPQSPAENEKASRAT